MRIPRFVLLIAIVVAYAAVAQTGAPMPAPALHILAAKNGENISNNFVTVQYELSTPVSAASTPTFQVRLDNRDPVQITDTQYTFTGLPAGAHTVTVQVVDANNTPLPGAQSQVQFTVQPQGQSSPTSPSGQGRMTEGSAARLEPAALNLQNDSQAPTPQPANPPANGDNTLPKSGSPLPLLSVIGMGVLVGGIASALRTRSRSRAR